MNVSADGVAVFNCSANAENINWKVNGKDPALVDPNIQLNKTMILERCLKSRSLIMNASSVCYNISNIKCFATTFHSGSTCSNISEPPAAYNVFGKSESHHYTVNVYKGT